LTPNKERQNQFPFSIQSSSQEEWLNVNSSTLGTLILGDTRSNVSTITTSVTERGDEEDAGSRCSQTVGKTITKYIQQLMQEGDNTFAKSVI